MRIRKLGLRRYGKFTDASIDFGERRSDGPDLHIVYGPNEAGKSTAMSACLDLLYGIHAQSRFNFLHPYPTMRIEAAIERSGETRSLARIKKPQNSLLDEADRPISDALLLGELGGLDRGAYQTMFCLDDETLEAGGDSILASKGDLGQLLFSATAGLADLSSRLQSVREGADAFYRPGKRSGELVDLKKQLSTLKDRRDEIDTLAAEYARLVMERSKADTDYVAMLAQRGHTQARIDEIQRLLNALPRLAAYRRLLTELEPLAALPEPPTDWAAKLPGLATRSTELTVKSRTTGEAVAECERELGELDVDTAARAMESRVVLLGDLRARYLTAEKDLPDRRLRLTAVEESVKRILTRIGRADATAPEDLILPTTVTGPLRDLIAKRSGIDAAVAAAEEEVANAREALGLAEAKLTDAVESDPEMLRSLSSAVEAARLNDVASRLHSAVSLHRERSDEWKDHLLELAPWKGDKDALLGMRVPDAGRIERWMSTGSDIARDVILHRQDRDRLAADVSRLERRIEALGSAGGIIGDKEAGEMRSAREAAWAEHVVKLDRTTAATFEASMRQLDLLTEKRFGQSAGVAEMNQALVDLTDARHSLDLAGERVSEADRRRAVLDAESKEAFKASVAAST